MHVLAYSGGSTQQRIHVLFPWCTRQIRDALLDEVKMMSAAKPAYVLIIFVNDKFRASYHLEKHQLAVYSTKNHMRLLPFVSLWSFPIEIQ